MNRRVRLSAPAACWLGWAAVALADAAVLIARLPWRIPLRARALIHFYDAAHLLALGLLAAALVALRHRLGPRSRLAALAALAALAWAVALVVLEEDLTGPAERLAGRLPARAVQAALSLAAALGIPAAALAGGLLARPGLRLLGVAGGVAAAVAHGLSYPSSYAGLHLLAAAAAAALTGASLAGAAIPARLIPPARARTALAAALSLAGAVSLTVMPGSVALSVLLRQPSAVLVPFLAPLAGGEDEGERRIPEGQRAWFTDRSGLPPIPPGSPPLLGPDALVFLLSVDSLRADVLANEAHRTALPELFRLRDESTWFTQARSPGASTAPTLAAVFSSLYYSQQLWVRGSRDDGLVYPDKDPSPRFPELLAQAGVATVTFDATGWLLNEHGVVRGFTEQRALRDGRQYTLAEPLMKATLERLRRHRGGRLFVFLHFMDAHAPYNSAGDRGSPFASYLASLGLVDRALSHLRMTLGMGGLLDRSCLILMADHGEAFGDHGLTWHANSLYDELIHVPLLIRLPGVTPRRIDDRVSLMDVAPTLVDLFGVPAPARWMGQSLTGYLRGERPALDRPIVAEARLKRAMVMPDGLKIVHDTRNHTVELYDLARDPGELEDLYEEDRDEERLLVLTSFFAAHALQRPGYNAPYRKW